MVEHCIEPQEPGIFGALLIVRQTVWRRRWLSSRKLRFRAVGYHGATAAAGRDRGARWKGRCGTINRAATGTFWNCLWLLVSVIGVAAYQGTNAAVPGPGKRIRGSGYARKCAVRLLYL